MDLVKKFLLSFDFRSAVDASDETTRKTRQVLMASIRVSRSLVPPSKTVRPGWAFFASSSRASRLVPVMSSAVTTRTAGPCTSVEARGLVCTWAWVARVSKSSATASGPCSAESQTLVGRAHACLGGEAKADGLLRITEYFSKGGKFNSQRPGVHWR